jgi:hypothetical protein
MTPNNPSPPASKAQFRSAVLVSRAHEAHSLMHAVSPSRAKQYNELEWLDSSIIAKEKKAKSIDAAKDALLFLEVANIRITPLPFLHPLDKCNAKFAKAYLPSVVSSLQSLLRISSVHVREIYNGDTTGNTAHVKCHTMELVEFVICFWDVGTDQYCAEIQRVRGDTQTFWSHARRILDVIHGNQTTIPSDDPLCFDLGSANACEVLYQTIGQRVLGKDFTVSTEELEKSLDLLIGFLESDHYDKDSIVLESLISMTDPTLSGVTTACAVAKMVLDPTSIIFQRLVTLIQSMGDQLLDDHAHVALRVAAKCCGLVGPSERKKIAEAFPEFIHWLKLAATQGDPHVAYCCIHILSYFVNDGLVSDFDMPDGMLRLGSTSHVALEKACGRLESAIATRDMH